MQGQRSAVVNCCCSFDTSSLVVVVAGVIYLGVYKMLVQSFVLLILSTILSSYADAFATLPVSRWGTPATTPMFAISSNSLSGFPDDASDSRSRAYSASELQQRMNEVRRNRLQEEERQRTRFVSGDELHVLRQQVLSLRQELEVARNLRLHDRVQQLEHTILQVQQVDAEFVYHVSLDRMRHAELQGNAVDAEKYRKEAMIARAALPQFNLDGLWVGKYGEHGFEMINVTYVGDVMIAYKVTGDQNVPKGEISFTVDLSSEAQAQHDMLEPIELAPTAAEQWGTRFLTRFAGKGQVAALGFKDRSWLEGQLILVGDYFSFAWLPISHQVFFGRPSAELTLKLLRESKSKENSDSKARNHLQRCWEETEILDDEMEISEDLFNSHDQQDYYHKQGCFE